MLPSGCGICHAAGRHVHLGEASRGRERDGFCLEAAKRLKIAVVPGNDFFIGSPEDCSFIRLNFSKPSVEDIEYGIEKLGELTFRYCS